MLGAGMAVQQLYPWRGLGHAVTPGDAGGEGSSCRAWVRQHGCPCWLWVLGLLVAEEAACHVSGAAVGDVVL